MDVFTTKHVGEGITALAVSDTGLKILNILKKILNKLPK